jgi:hypothetical protein
MITARFRFSTPTQVVEMTVYRRPWQSIVFFDERPSNMTNIVAADGRMWVNPIMVERVLDIIDIALMRPDFTIPIHYWFQNCHQSCLSFWRNESLGFVVTDHQLMHGLRFIDRLPCLIEKKGWELDGLSGFVGQEICRLWDNAYEMKIELDVEPEEIIVSDWETRKGLELMARPR